MKTFEKVATTAWLVVGAAMIPLCFIGAFTATLPGNKERLFAAGVVAAAWVTSAFFWMVGICIRGIWK